MSQNTEELWKGTETTEREGLDNMACTEGQLAWRAGRVEKSKLEAERSRERAERTGTAEEGVGAGLYGQDKASATTFLEPGTWTMSLVNSAM